MDNCILTVYCLTYNHEKYIEQTLKGFVSQKTNFRYKVLVHDDCSTDGTADIVRKYAEKYPDIIVPVFEEENQYSKDVNVIRTVLLPMFEGEYIAACEGDDYWCDENKLQKQVDFLNAHPEYVACIHNTYELNTRTGKKRLINSSNEDYDVPFSQIIEGGNSVFQMSSLMWRHELEKVYESEDRPAFLKVPSSFGDYQRGIFLCANGKMRFLKEVMSVYRYMTPGSWTSRNHSVSAIEKTCVSMKEMLLLVDDYTEKKYHKDIEKVILNKEFWLLTAKKDISAMRSKKYKAFWDKMSSKEKLKLYVKKYLPFVEKILYK